MEVRELSVNQLNIKPCLGCFACWNKTPGKCCMGDDMAQVIENLLWADVTIWSFPLYYFSVPGPLKNLMDRQLPMVLPFMTADSESGSHPGRYDMSGKRTVVISTCGFYTAKGNYDGVNAMFDHLCGKNNYTPIYCGQG
jgi:multimeric flavodoxin WrbA